MQKYNPAAQKAVYQTYYGIFPGISTIEEESQANTPGFSEEELLEVIHSLPEELRIVFNLVNALGITFAPHYYFDHNSNVFNQSYTEQRNSLGVALGIKYSF